MGFGTGPLSHPLLVEAIEELFVPVLVYNNREGADAELLKRFGERAWNNPVVRFLDAAGKDVIPRKDAVWTEDRLSARMLEALRVAGREAPAWLKLAADELQCTSPARAVFAMHCFWEGEAALGALDGVVATRPAFVGDEEVVEVLFDERRLGFEQLVRTAQSLVCASTIYCADPGQLDLARKLAGEKAKQASTPPRETPASDRKHALRASPLWRLPMTPAQQSRVNAALSRGEDAANWLSPRQSALARRMAEAAKSGRLDVAGEPAETLEGLPAYARKLAELLGEGP